MKLTIHTGCLFVLGFGLLSATGGVAIATGISKPHTFSPGEVISSSKLNENFDTLYDAVGTSNGSGSASGDAPAVYSIVLGPSDVQTLLTTGIQIPGLEAPPADKYHHCDMIQFEKPAGTCCTISDLNIYVAATSNTSAYPADAFGDAADKDTELQSGVEWFFRRDYAVKETKFPSYDAGNAKGKAIKVIAWRRTSPSVADTTGPSLTIKLRCATKLFPF